MEGIYLLIGCVIGAVGAYFIIRWKFRSDFVPRNTLKAMEQQLRRLEQENAARLSKQEVQEQYISRELGTHYQQELQQLETKLSAADGKEYRLQQEILELTRVAEQKFSREEIAARDQRILQLNTELTTYREKEKGLKEQIAVFHEQLEQLHRFSQERFKTLANEVLEEKRKRFVDENKKELSSILDPLKTDLTQFKEKVDATRKEDIREITSLKKEIASLQQLNMQLSDDAKNLAHALKAEVKMQGDWGEDRLNMILETEGLQKYIDYTREEVYTHTTDDKVRRPDFILKLPNNKHLIIDSKVSLTAYVNYFNAADPAEKQRYLKQHIKSVTEHIEQLTDKNYQSLSGLSAPDYVFLFMPVESALTLALNQHPDLFNHALAKKIVLITPTTLVATLKIVRLLWQKENQVKNVAEIFRQCGELYNKFVFFLEEMDRMEAALSQATRAHRDAMNHLKDGTKKGNTILGRFEKIKSLEAKTHKQIPEKHLAELELLPDDEPETGETTAEV